MEPNETENKEECRKRCHGKCCCCGKLFLAFLLMLIGGILGYLIGTCHGTRSWHGMGMGYCPPMMQAPMPSTPQQK